MRNNLIFFIVIVFFVPACQSVQSSDLDESNRFFEKGDYVRTVNTIDNISKKRILNFDERKLRGLSYGKMNNYLGAIRDYRYCWELKKNDKTVLFNLAQCYSTIGAKDSAIVFYSHLLGIDSTNSTALNERALCYINKQRLDDALSDLKKARQLDPNSYMVYNNIGQIAEIRGNYLDAVKNYNISIAKNDKEDLVYYNRAISYMSLHKSDSAMSDFGKAIAINPTESAYYLNRGLAYHELKKDIEACRDIGWAALLKNKSAVRIREKYCK
ncbi:tetratricopeptide repeat protein [Mucilaginibacter sp.]|uniref:tetratricopeptide repeat protein n=1 Tax=Mucilaginibacter sp. TaxID=1882438 RepID=UPI0025D70EBF|nr:tetratricopeptide repeat protein [Mucilaginibacter sp.]